MSTTNTAEYQRAYRKSNPGYYQRQQALKRARAAARRLLADAHSVELSVIFFAIRQREGYATSPASHTIAQRLREEARRVLAERYPDEFDAYLKVTKSRERLLCPTTD